MNKNKFSYNPNDPTLTFREIYLPKITEYNYNYSFKDYIIDLISKTKKKVTEKEYAKYIKDQFATVCQDGILSEAKYLYKKYDLDIHFDIHFDNDCLFRFACYRNDFKMAEWLYSLGGVNIHAVDEYAFKYTVFNHDLRMAKWIYDLGINDSNAGKINININNDSIFQNLCKYSTLENAKWLYSLGIESGSKININANDDNAFVSACNNIFNNYNIAIWLYELGLETGSVINLSAQDNDAFRYCFTKKNYEFAKWLYSKSTESIESNKINIHSQDEYAFIACCTHGDIEMVKWLYNVSLTERETKINIHARSEYAFIHFCSCNLEMAKWIYNLSMESETVIDPIKYACAFRLAISSGQIDTCKWLYSLGVINIHNQDDYAFRLSCTYNYLEIAQWIYSIEPNDYMIRIDDDYLFKQCCKRKLTDFVLWLESICPYYSHVNDCPIISDNISKDLLNDDIVEKYIKPYDNKDYKLDNVCVICTESPKYFIIMKCNHVACLKCFKMLDQCYYRCVKITGLFDNRYIKNENN
jgi:hypothetical protein